MIAPLAGFWLLPLDETVFCLALFGPPPNLVILVADPLASPETELDVLAVVALLSSAVESFSDSVSLSTS